MASDGGNDAAFDALEAQIRRLKGLGDLPTVVAPAVAVVLRATITEQIAAGTTPDGTPWEPTALGAVPLQHAAKALTVQAIGSSVVARLTGPEARHHLGTASGGIVRQILPSSELPQAAIEAVRRVAVTGFTKVMAGG